MNDLDRFIAERALRDPEFAEDFERTYQSLEFGDMLKQARRDAGLTQQAVAERLGTHKSAISRMENHAEDVRLSTLQRYAEAVGCILTLGLRPESEGRIPRAIQAYRGELAQAPPAGIRTRRSKAAARYAEHGD